MKVGCRTAISKPKSGKINIIRNQPLSTYTVKGEASDQNHTWHALVASLLLRCVKGGKEDETLVLFEHKCFMNGPLFY